MDGCCLHRIVLLVLLVCCFFPVAVNSDLHCLFDGLQRSDHMVLRQGFAYFLNKVFMLGGLRSNCTIQAHCPPLADMVEFNFVDATWLPRPPLPTPRADMATTSLGWDNGAYHSVFAIGGFEYDSFQDEYSVVSTVEEYRVDKNTWISRPSLVHARTKASVVAVGRRLYVLGGIKVVASSTQDLDADVFVAEVEMYDPLVGHWFILPDSKNQRSKFIPRMEMAVTSVVLPSLGACIITLGGHGPQIDSKGTTQIYATESHHWFTFDDLQLRSQPESIGIAEHRGLVYMVASSHGTGASGGLATSVSKLEYTRSQQKWAIIKRFERPVPLVALIPAFNALYLFTESAFNHMETQSICAVQVLSIIQGWKHFGVTHSLLCASLYMLPVLFCLMVGYVRLKASFGHHQVWPYMRPTLSDKQVLRRLEIAGHQLNPISYLLAVFEPLPSSAVLITILNIGHLSLDLGFLLFVSLTDTRTTLLCGLAAWGCSLAVRGLMMWADERPPMIVVALRVLFHVDMFRVMRFAGVPLLCQMLQADIVLRAVPLLVLRAQIVIHDLQHSASTSLWDAILSAVSVLCICATFGYCDRRDAVWQSPGLSPWVHALALVCSALEAAMRAVVLSCVLLTDHLAVLCFAEAVTVALAQHQARVWPSRHALMDLIAQCFIKPNPVSTILRHGGLLCPASHVCGPPLPTTAWQHPSALGARAPLYLRALPYYSFRTVQYALALATLPAPLVGPPPVRLVRYLLPVLLWLGLLGLDAWLARNPGRRGTCQDVGRSSREFPFTGSDDEGAEDLRRRCIWTHEWAAAQTAYVPAISPTPLALLPSSSESTLDRGQLLPPKRWPPVVPRPSSAGLSPGSREGLHPSPTLAIEPTSPPNLTPHPAPGTDRDPTALSKDACVGPSTQGDQGSDAANESVDSSDGRLSISDYESDSSVPGLEAGP
uniref:Uncharacterized protein n=1 Tax=Eutreptiella gymnastica TaxID=73025 RepID=A0A7S1J6D9_9EUGL|mmetsp:Transcript_71271/g.125391  ORF Transcript_71271/g.125391 Transcript_71271/m.125391 type:complete len:940 (+) Transcript_71271:60-2879(+)